MLPVVRTIESQMSTDVMLNHEYLPIDGLKSFTEGATRLVLGSDGPAVIQNRVSYSKGRQSVQPFLKILCKKY